MDDDKKIELGDRAKDRVTGYTGIVIARTEFLNGCIRFSIQAENVTADGKPIADEWFDDTQIDILEKRFYFGDEAVLAVASVGGPRDHNPARSDAPTR